MTDIWENHKLTIFALVGLVILLLLSVRIVPETQQGVVVAVDTGTATVNATVDGVFSNTVQVTVKLVPVNNITVNPNPASVTVNNTLQFTATLRDSNGNILVGRPIVWATSDANKATITAAGVLTGLSTGTLTVTATSEGVVGTANVTVLP